MQSFYRETSTERPFFATEVLKVFPALRVLRPSECRTGGVAFQFEAYHSQSNRSPLLAETLKAVRTVSTVPASATASHETDKVKDTTAQF